VARADGIGLASDADYHRRFAETERQPRSDFTGGSLYARGKHGPKKRLRRPAMVHDALDQALIHRASRARAKHGTEALAKRAGVRVETISRLDRGKHRPHQSTIVKLDEAFEQAGV
jgi:ribosome-binding protein aMBF1 (putative translation factor)